MPPKESRYPKDWLSLAEKDLVRVKRSLRDRDPELAAFCLQQVVEKFLKAFLLSKSFLPARLSLILVLPFSLPLALSPFEEVRRVVSLDLVVLFVRFIVQLDHHPLVLLDDIMRR